MKILIPDGLVNERKLNLWTGFDTSLHYLFLCRFDVGGWIDLFLLAK